MPHHCMRKGVRNSCVAMVSGAKGGTKGVVSSPCEDIPSDLKETEAHLRTAGEVLGQVVRFQSRAAFQVPV